MNNTFDAEQIKNISSWCKMFMNNFRVFTPFIFAIRREINVTKASSDI